MKGAGLRYDRVDHWPFPFHYYLGRALWRLVQATLWKICWDRLYVLRPFILKLFGAKVSLKFRIGPGVDIEMPWLLTAGDYVTLGPRARVYNLGPVTLGNNVVISQDTYLCGGTHDYRDPQMTLVRKPVTIKDGAWVCAGAFIGPGVTVGEGAVVGARACAMKDVKAWTVVAGNPAKTIGRRKLRENKGKK